MQPKYELTDNPAPEAFQKIWASLLRFNEDAIGNAGARTLAILLKEPTTDELIGGLWARSLWGSLYIDMMFVPETLRGNGIGTSLLRQAEQEAIQRGCRNIWMDTYAFQARPFYEKLGFSIFGRLDGPAPTFPRFFLKNQQAVKKSQSAPGFKPVSVPTLGQQTFAGTSTMGAETHIGLGALDHNLIVGATLAGYDATPDNATKLVAMARRQDDAAKRSVGPRGIR